MIRLNYVVKDFEHTARAGILFRLFYFKKAIIATRHLIPL